MFPLRGGRLHYSELGVSIEPGSQQQGVGCSRQRRSPAHYPHLRDHATRPQEALRFHLSVDHRGSQRPVWYPCDPPKGGSFVENTRYHSFILKKKIMCMCVNMSSLTAYLTWLLPTCILPKCFPAHPWPCTPVVSLLPFQGHRTPATPVVQIPPYSCFLCRACFPPECSRRSGRAS